MKYLKNPVFLLCWMLCCVSCDDDDLQVDSIDVRDFVSALPEQVTYPDDNITSEDKVALGRLLFWDPILSGNKDVACATCHHPDFGYSDGLKVPKGVGGEGLGPGRQGGTTIRRNSPSIINTAFNGIKSPLIYNPATAPMFWDLRATSLETQALKPLHSSDEMKGEHISDLVIMDTLVLRLQAIEEYQRLFAQVYGTEGITPVTIERSIADFERTIIANNSRFDQYMRGDLGAMTGLEVEGMRAFVQIGCANCHSGPMLSDFALHNTGVAQSRAVPDDGAGSFDFRTPTLRSLSVTAPYMHNGSLASLEEVMEFYQSAARGELTPEGGVMDVNMIQLRPQGRRQTEAIIQFLKALDDPDFDRTVPDRVPSGLSVGGNI